MTSKHHSKLDLSQPLQQFAVIDASFKRFGAPIVYFNRANPLKFDGFAADS